MFSAKVRTAQPLLAYTNIPLRKHREMRKRSLLILLTAPFNNMRTLKFKAQLTNAFFATVSQQIKCLVAPRSF